MENKKKTRLKSACKSHPERELELHTLSYVAFEQCSKNVAIT